MKKVITSLLIFILLLSVLTACGTKSGEAAKVLGLDVSKGEEISNYDTHGGFHGDGTTCIAYRFDDDTIDKMMQRQIFYIGIHSTLL